jgi:hypothetical protein
MQRPEYEYSTDETGTVRTCRVTFIDAQGRLASIETSEPIQSTAPGNPMPSEEGAAGKKAKIRAAKAALNSLNL